MCSTRHYCIGQAIDVLLLIATVVLLIADVSACGPGRGIGGPRRSRKISALVFKQHVPNMSENTLGGSGISEGNITRHDPKFRDLVPNYNKDIIFKDEEGTGADRLMSQRCKEKLNTLAVSVMNEWPGVRLRVIEGWDEQSAHGDNSLHYEGRAVDITTSDRDRGKNGMLARLAVEAGFDWVYYESRAHVHCSVKSDSSQASHTSGCFSANSTVLTATGERRRLADLQLGESVLSMDTAGQPVYSEVLMFMDRDPQQTREFVRLETEGGAHVTVTPGHLVLVWRRETGLTGYRFASQVEEGDHLLVAIDGDAQADGGHRRVLEPRLVVRISEELHRGVFAPLTREGTIVVDGVAASCYAMVNSQRIAHWSFAPVRAWRTVQRWMRWLGVPTGAGSGTREPEFEGRSSTASDGSVAEAAEQPASGIHWYASALYSIKDVFLPSSWIYRS